MNTTFRPFLIITAIVAGTFAVSANAAISLSDMSTAYNVDNWYGYRSSANIRFSSSDNSITFSQANDSSYIWGYFDAVSLEVGQSLTFTGTFEFGTIASGGVFSSRDFQQWTLW